MRPGGNREKGVGWELIVAKQIAKDLGGFDQQRYLPRAPESGARIQWKGDIVAADKLASIWPFLIECKKQEGWQLEGLLKNDNKHIIKEWYTKAAEQAKESYGKTPILIFARNYQPWLVAFPLSIVTPRMLLPKSPCTYVAFVVDVKGEQHAVGILTYQNFIDLFLKPEYGNKIKQLGILPGQYKSTTQEGTPGK
jgi:hypothetical protein